MKNTWKISPKSKKQSHHKTTLLYCTHTAAVFVYRQKTFQSEMLQGGGDLRGIPVRAAAPLPACAISVQMRNEPSRYETMPKSTSQSACDLLRQDPVCDGTRVLLWQIAALLADCLLCCRRSDVSSLSRRQSTWRKICVLPVSGGVCTHSHSSPSPRDVPEELAVQAARFAATVFRVRLGAPSLTALLCSPYLCISLVGVSRCAPKKCSNMRLKLVPYFWI